MSTEQQLDKIRQQIDKLDKTILASFNQRAICAQQIADIKQNDSDKPVYYRPEREAQVLRNIIEQNQGPLSDEVTARLFRELMSACLALQVPQKVAFLGPSGTFTQAAALKFFGQFIDTIPLPSIDEVFREVESGAANYGIVPIENSTEGVVNHTLDSFIHSSLKICGEITIPIHHHLLSDAERIEDLTVIFSHQQSFAQCREWLDRHVPNIERIAVASNAKAAKMAKAKPDAAAVAGTLAADTYQLNKLASNIEDKPDNTTRFLVIAKQFPPSSGKDKTSFLLSSPNKPGSLYKLLAPFADNDISLNRIESRPSPSQNLWDYVFFIDVDGHLEDKPIQKVITQMENNSIVIKHLGSYPCAVL